MITNYYIPFGGLPFHEALFMSQSMITKYIGLVAFSPRIIWGPIVFISALFLLIPQKHWSKILYFVASVDIFLIVASYF